MLKNYKDCQLKGQILNQIRSGNVTAKGIFTNIGYKGHIDSLYSELNELNKYGYLSIKKVGIFSHYTLTKKGLKHALNPTLQKEARFQRYQKRISGEVENTLRNEPLVKEWAMKFAQEIAEHPIQEHIHKPPNIINSAGKTVEFIDTNTQQQPQISDAQKRLDEIIALLSSQTPLKKVDEKRLKREQQDLIQVRNREKSKAMRDAQDKRVADAIKNKDKPEPDKIDSKPLNTGCKECKSKEDTIDRLLKEKEGLNQQLIANSPLYREKNIVKEFIDQNGNVMSNEKALQKFKKGAEKQKQTNARDKSRDVLFKRYGGNYLDYAFFKKYGMMPYWVIDVKDIGIAAVGFKWHVEILLHGSQEVNKGLREGHAKPMSASDIADAGFKVINIEPTTGWHQVMGRGMKTFKRM